MGTFDASVRILVCSNCGASLPPVGPEGGSVQCAFCNHASFVGVRDDGSISSGQPVDEAARIASLWRQVDTGFNVHAEVTQLGEHGQLTERNVESARQQWEAARAIAADPAQAASIGDDLMWLTTLLVGYWAGQGDRQRHHQARPFNIRCQYRAGRPCLLRYQYARFGLVGSSRGNDGFSSKS